MELLGVIDLKYRVNPQRAIALDGYLNASRTVKTSNFYCY